MLLDFFDALRRAKLPVSISEYLVLLDALSKGIGTGSLDNLYQLSRMTLVKDESFYDRFDQVFAAYWEGRAAQFDSVFDAIPEEWLNPQNRPQLTDEEMAAVEAMGGWDELMETLRKRIAEQDDEHHGGSKWVGTGGTSPFGHSGYNPMGIRIGGKSTHRRATKVWQERRYKDLDGSVELGTRNFKMALRKLRKMARSERLDKLDLSRTISSTAKNGGLLDIHMTGERRNSVKVLLLLDVGGSMDWHAALTSQLFSAAASEFGRLEHFYFHNFIYENLWTENARRHTDHLSVDELIRTYSREHRLILVGDASMSPYEIVAPGGSVEHWNEEPGALWMQRLIEGFPHCVWLNPEPQDRWHYTQSIGMVESLIGGRMHPLTVDGIQNAIKHLKKPLVTEKA